MKRARVRFTKAKWPAKAISGIMDAVAEVFPDSEVLLVRAGGNIPILDINVYSEDFDEESLKELEKRILTTLTEHDISHVVFKGIKIFDVSSQQQ